MVILPDVGSISRFTILSVVVLPHPDGPSSTQISPSATSIDDGSAAMTVTRRRLERLGDVLELDHAGVLRAWRHTTGFPARSPSGVNARCNPSKP